MTMRGSFTEAIRRPNKRATGRAGVEATPLHIRTVGPGLPEGFGEHVRAKLGRKLGKFAHAIERVSVRFADVNGPRGGVDTVSRIKVVLSELPSIIVESRAADAQEAFDLASHRTETSVRRQLEKADVTRPPRAKAARKARPRPARPSRPAVPDGSLIGARVGRSAANLRRTLEWRPPLDTSLPGVSASDRKAGGGSTAARNVKLSNSKATAALEDSATGKPSRKSTRGSAQRAKQGSKQGRRAKVRAASPKRRATNARVRANRGRSRNGA
jgi:ribosome-associated translation inhibitor RaiA